MILTEPGSKAVRGELARSVSREAERFRNGASEERVAKRVENQSERTLCDVMVFMPEGQLCDEAANRIEDRIERVAVAGEDHPCGERAGPFPVENVEGPIDDVTGVGFARPRPLNCLGDARGDGFGDGSGKLPLKPGRRAEMMKKVRVSPADLCRHRLQSDRLRPVGKQKSTCSVDCGGTALLRSQSSSSSC